MDIIDDKYWLKYGKTSVEQSLSSRNTAAAKLEKMTLWFWGLYTASFTIGVSIKIIEAPIYVLILLASPIVLLILTYWFCILAQLPVHAEFDPAIPYEIKEAYNAGLKVKNNRFSIARMLTLVSASLLSIALFSLSFLDKKESSSLNVSYDKKSSTLVISGQFPKEVVLKTEIDSINSRSERIVFYSNIFRIQENGILNLNVPLNKLPKEIYVSTTWKDKKTRKGLTRVLDN